MSENEIFKVESPAQMNGIFAVAYNSGAVENLLALYEPQAVHVNNEAGESSTGLEAIKSELQNLLKLGGTMISENQYAFQTENIALLRAKFTLKTTCRKATR